MSSSSVDPQEFNLMKRVISLLLSSTVVIFIFHFIEISKLGELSNSYREISKQLDDKTL